MNNDSKLKMRILLFYLLLVYSARLLAQNGQRARGVSSAGPLELEIKKISAATEMICTADFKDINDDGTLSPDETIEIHVFIRNYSKTAAIQPKIEMIRRSGGNAPPTMQLFGLKQVNPGEIGSHRESVVWKQDIKPGLLIYRIRAIDSVSGFKTDWLEITLQVSNPYVKDESELNEEEY